MKIPILTALLRGHPLLLLERRGPGETAVYGDGLEPASSDLRRLPGIREVDHQAAARMLVVRFLPESCDEEAILASIYRTLGRTSPRELLRQADRAVKSWSGGSVDLAGLLPLGLACYGLALAMRQGVRAPANLTMMFWAYTWFYRRNRE